MSLDNKQIEVLKGVIPGVFIALAVVLLGAFINPFGFDSSLTTIDRLMVASMSSLMPALFLAISIGRVARRRFFSRQDIDGSGLVVESPQARILQSLLQNTLEQALLAALIYYAWSVVMPATWLSVVPFAALCFGLGRTLFFIYYADGAPARAIGFSLTFYPSLVMLLGVISISIWRLMIYA